MQLTESNSKPAFSQVSIPPSRYPIVASYPTRANLFIVSSSLSSGVINNIGCLKSKINAVDWQIEIKN